MFLSLVVDIWMDMPLEYGSYKTCWKRLKRWQEEGVWDRILKALASMNDHNTRVSVDSTTVDAKNKRGEMIGYDGFKHK